jgi:peroxiredoxin Q/BCP
MPNHEASVAYNEKKLAAEGITALKAGDVAPEIVTSTADGQPFSLAGRLAEGRRVLLYFYPANDAPNTTRQLIELSKALPELAARGIDAYAVNPGAVQEGADFARRYQFSVPLLADPTHAIAQAYGCAAKDTRYPQRTVVGVGPDGKVVFFARGFLYGVSPLKSALGHFGLDTASQGAAAQPGGTSPGGAAPGAANAGATPPRGTAPGGAH